MDHAVTGGSIFCLPSLLPLNHSCCYL